MCQSLKAVSELAFIAQTWPKDRMMIADNTALDLFRGIRLLLLEDGYLLSDQTGARLTRLGTTLVGPLHDKQDALAALHSGVVHAAVIDVALDTTVILPVITALEQRRIPFLFAVAGSPDAQADYPGFILSPRDADLRLIASTLFLKSSTDH
jgi:hypothetical protein